MKRMIPFVLALVAIALVACDDTSPAGSPNDGGVVTGDMVFGVDMPVAAAYIPFSASNFVAQQARVAIYEEIAAARKAAGFDATKCGDPDAPTAGTLAEIYTRNDTSGGVLRDKVKGCKDDHSYNRDATIGATMDQVITKALVDCKSGSLVPKLAGQLVEKTLQGFFYASVFHELVLGAKGDTESKAKWDEAFGYYGRSTDGTTSRGIASTAKKRDENFRTTLNDTIFSKLIEGRNILAASPIDTAAIAVVADKIDKTLLTVFAYSTAREFVMIPGSADGAELLAEGIGFYSILDPYMTSVVATDAQYIRQQLATADFMAPAAIDTAGIVARIETAFGIDVTP